MSKRITLSDFDIEQIVAALTVLRDESGLSYEVIRVGQRYYDRLIEKLKNDHFQASAKSEPVLGQAPGRESIVSQKAEGK